MSFLGVSGKSQIMFAMVFITRYLDLLTNFISLYNTTMKLVFISCSVATVYLMFAKFKATYDSNHDTFRMEFLVVPVAGLAFLVNHDFSPLEVHNTVYYCCCANVMSTTLFTFHHVLIAGTWFHVCNVADQINNFFYVCIVEYLYKLI